MVYVDHPPRATERTTALLIALADPTRRKIFERLWSTDHTVGQLATLAKVSQPAVSQHLKVLRDAGLVFARAEGVRRHYRAIPGGLTELRAYIESYWDGVLAAFAADDSSLPHGAHAGSPRALPPPLAPTHRSHTVRRKPGPSPAVRRTASRKSP